MGDGHLNKCISCCKEQAKQRTDFLRRSPDWIESEKNRAREKYHRLYAGKLPKVDYDKKKEIMERYKAKYPEKMKSKNATSNMKPKVKENNFHHWSYNDEHMKDVIELSVLEHNKAHRYMIYDQERKMYRTTKGVLLDTRQAHEQYIHSLAELP